MSFKVRKLREDEKPSKLRQLAAVGLPIVHSMLRMQEHLQHSKQEDERKTTREKTLKRTVAILVSILLALLLLIGMLKAIVRVKEIAIGMVTLAGAELPKDDHDYTNVLLLGEGDNDHDGIDLTDTIMVASLDPEHTKSAVLLSIPRDTYVLKTDKMGRNRINSLYRDYKTSLIRKGTEKDAASKEALQQLATEVGTLIGLPIHGVVKVNFSGFEQGVDLIGGIDVDVPEDLVDPEYPGPNYTYETFSIAAGPQHLDGATALKYARSRHSTSDFSRSARQQQIIAAAAQKVEENGLIGNIGKLSEMLSLVSKNVESTFSSRELLGLAAMGKKIDRSRIINVNLNDQNGLYGSLVEPGGFLYSPPRDQFDGAAVLLPFSVPETPVTWRQIHVLSELIFRTRILFLRPSTIVSLNAGAKEGVARKVGGELYRYEFNVVKTRNIAKGLPAPDESYIAINPALKNSEDEAAQSRLKFAEATAKFLGTTLKLKTGELDASGFTPENADIAIVLGKDYKYTLLQDLIETE